MDETRNAGEALPRGGRLIRTERGNLQYGIPPETIKDTMKREGGVPHTFIVPPAMFDLVGCVSSADIEFPVYFNFFIRKGRARIVCTPEQQKRITTVLSEALFGPATLDLEPEFAAGRETPGFPDLRAEMDLFRRMPMAKSGFLELSDLVEFRPFDGEGVALVDGFEIRRERNGDLVVREDGRELARVPRQEDVMARAPRPPANPAPSFRPPRFGITTLGAGHGFDPNADTSGLIVWTNRRGIVVDPPVGSTEDLLRMGVSPKLIDKVILTHCHADHDAGTLQKILREGMVNLYTTPTVFAAFLRKAAALTGVEEEDLRRLVHFFPVRIGEAMMIDGARFQFHYTLHSIPTIALQASLEERSLIYSSDTMNDPAFIRKLHESGVLSRNRMDFLLAFPWDRDLIFHEAGIPPLHTPLPFLCSLPRATRERLYLVHVNPDQVPPDSGLRIAPTGLANTIDLGLPPQLHDESIGIIDALALSGLFENMPFAKAREVLLSAQMCFFTAGAVIFRKGDPGDKFYVVLRGEVDIVLDDRVLTTYTVGGFFGDKSLFVTENRTASAVARTGARLVCIDKDEMLALIRGTESEYLLRQIALHQNVELRRTMAANPLFQGLTPTQQTRLHGLIKSLSRVYGPGETILREGAPDPFAYLVKDGSVEIRWEDGVVETLGRGGLFGVRTLFGGPVPGGLTFAARDQVTLYYLEHYELKEYLERNPGFHIRLYNHPY